MPDAGEIVNELRALHFMDRLGEEHLTRLASMASWRHLPAGAIVFREGAAADGIHLVVEGQVSLEICAPGVGCKRICTLQAGELLGWSPVLEQPTFTATARTLTPARLLRLEGRQVLALCQRDPSFGYEFMRRVALAIAKRLKATRLQLCDVFGGQLPSAEIESNSSFTPATEGKDSSS